MTSPSIPYRMPPIKGATLSPLKGLWYNSQSGSGLFSVNNTLSKYSEDLQSHQSINYKSKF